MDLCLYGKNNGYTPAQVADAVGLTPEQTQSVYAEIDNKRVATGYLHMQAQLVDKVPEIVI